MKFKKLFDRKNKDYVTIKVNTSNVPDGLLRKCKKCSSIVLAEDVKNNNYICPKCGGYFRVHAYRRIEMVVDKDSFEPMFEGLNTRNPLKIKGYEAKVQALRDRLGLMRLLQQEEPQLVAIRWLLPFVTGVSLWQVWVKL